MKKLLILAGLFVLFAAAVNAQACTPPTIPSSTQSLVSQISSLNQGLQSCPLDLGSPANRFFKNENLLLQVGSNNIMFQIRNAQLSGVSTSTSNPTYSATISECHLDAILSNSNPLGALAAVYSQRNIQLRAHGFGNRMKFLFARPFLSSALRRAQIPLTVNCNAGASAPVTSSGQHGQPDNCDETFMEGHREYQFAREEWDRRKAESAGVCQTPINQRPSGGNCLYLFQQIEPTSGASRWLCWYD